MSAPGRRRSRARATAIVLPALLALAMCSRDPWDRKDAHACRRRMLHGLPMASKPSCRAVGARANEATPTPAARAKLDALVRRLGCAPP